MCFFWDTRDVVVLLLKGENESLAQKSEADEIWAKAPWQQETNTEKNNKGVQQLFK